MDKGIRKAGKFVARHALKQLAVREMCGWHREVIFGYQTVGNPTSNKSILLDIADRPCQGLQDFMAGWLSANDPQGVQHSWEPGEQGQN